MITLAGSTIMLADAEATEALGGCLAQHSPASLALYLAGELGAGKTTLVRGFLRRLGHTGPVKSPTYTLVESYSVKQRCVFHFDLYRIAAPEELAFIGIRDYFSQPAICLVEWPEKGQGMLLSADLTCTIALRPTGRSAELEAHTLVGAELLSKLKN